MEDAPKSQLVGLSREEMEELLSARGEPRYRGGQLFHALYGERLGELSSITTLPSRLRKKLDQEFKASLPSIEKKYQSSDGTARYLLRLGDGRDVEAVLMPENERNTICLSTQVGCAVDCKFCLTGVMGFQRNLSPGEIVSQVMVIMQDSGLRIAKPETAGSGKRLNLVFMGMGEPLLNYENVMRAVKLLIDPEGLAIPLSNMTLSTSGIVPGIRKLAEEPIRPKLAVSINASNDEVRDRIMPINRKWPLSELLQACREFPLRHRERLTFEYVLLEGVNDTVADAHRLSKLVGGISCKINIIGLNPGSELPFSTPPQERVIEFQRTLISHGLPAYIRKPRGRDIFAACGQLKLAGEEMIAGLQTGSR